MSAFKGAGMAEARRRSRAGFLAGWLLIVWVMATGLSPAEPALVPSAPVEEKLVYDISFLIFKNAAVGSLTMKFLPDRGLYEGVVAARTKGFIGLVSLFRQDRYRSVMRLDGDGRLVPVEFHKEVVMGGFKSVSSTFLDYDSGMMWWSSTESKRDDTEMEFKTHRIPPGTVYEDCISSFFNLRRGVCGPINPGKVIRVFSIPARKWFKERQRKPQFFSVTVGSRKTGADGLSGQDIAITVPKELFGQKVGAVRFRVREDNVPSRILVKKAIVFGDMRGMLRSRRTGSGRIATGGPLKK